VDVAALPDALLVARCRDGDPDAWRELVQRYSRYVYAIAVQAFRLAEHEADDVFQDVFSRVYENLSKLRDDDALRPWIAQVARRQCINRLRSAGREQPSEQDADIVDPEDTLGRLDESLTVHEALARLPGHCREILDRFFARDESYRQIGEALELPAGTIASRISRCLKKLREDLEGRNPAPGGS
jgi:RNA polymerase sigma-70 factor (ECF subfamily)